MPADPTKGTQVAIAPALIPAGAAAAGMLLSPRAISSALTAIGLGKFLDSKPGGILPPAQGSAKTGRNTTEDSISRRTEEDDIGDDEDGSASSNDEASQSEPDTASPERKRGEDIGQDGSKNAQSDRERAKSVKSFEKLIDEHERKLDEYDRDPDAHDNQGRLKHAKTPEHRENIIKGRKETLRRAIERHRKNIERTKDGE